MADKKRPVSRKKTYSDYNQYGDLTSGAERRAEVDKYAEDWWNRSKQIRTDPRFPQHHSTSAEPLRGKNKGPVGTTANSGRQASKPAKDTSDYSWNTRWNQTHDNPKQAHNKQHAYWDDDWRSIHNSTVHGSTMRSAFNNAKKKK